MNFVIFFFAAMVSTILNKLLLHVLIEYVTLSTHSL